MRKNIIPDNLQSLWAEENAIFAWAKERMVEVPHLRDQLELIEGYMDAVDTLRQTGGQGDRWEVIAALFIRTFDNFSGALQLAMRGNYRLSVMALRDQLETEFLLDYMVHQPDAPTRWLRARSRREKDEFSPVRIRKWLDERDGFTERKREAAYKMLSSLGAHPCPEGLELYRDGTGKIRLGPFKHRASLQQCIEEAARRAYPLAATLLHYWTEDKARTDTFPFFLSLIVQKISEKYFAVTHPSSAH